MKINWFRRKQRDEELDAEIRHQLDEAIRDRIARGEAPDEARANAVREFGNVGLIKEVTREMWGWAWLEQLMQDLCYGARMLWKQPGFTLIAVLTLALGIGANTAIFSVVNAVLLRPLPFKEPERLVAAWSVDLRNPQGKLPVSALDLIDWRAQSQTVESFGAWFTMDLTMTGRSEPLHVKAKGTMADLLGLLGIAPLHGRVFQPGDHYAVVLSHALWQRKFNADPHVIGQSLTLAEENYVIVGVMPSGFQFPLEAEVGDLWLAWEYAKMPDAPTMRRDARLSEAIARLRPGATLAQAQAEMERITAALRHQYPDTNKDIGARLVPLEKNLTSENRRALWILFGAVGCVLLIACVNVANLLLARATGRQRELAVCAALGASRARLMRRLLTESLLLALAGGVLGSLVALWSVDALLALNPVYLPGAESMVLDSRVLGFTFLLSLLTSVLCGLAPAWRVSKIDLVTALKEGLRTASENKGQRRLRDALVVTEVALSLVLLTGAALLLHSFWRMRQADPGFDARQLLTFRLSLSYQKYDAAKAGEFFRRLQSRLHTLPGVRAAANVFPLPLNDEREFNDLDSALDARFEIEGQPMRAHERPPYDPRTVQPGYFDAMGIRLTRGRAFDEHDIEAAAPVAVINEALARRYFADTDPIGKRVRLSSLVTPQTEPLRQIVGVVADVKHRGVMTPARPEIYVPFAQSPFQEMFVVVKTDVEPASLTSAVRAAVLELDRDLPIFNVKTMEQRLGQSFAESRFNALLLAVFAWLALALAAIGLYGVLAYVVAERTHELGVRVALGAQARDIFSLVLKRGLALAGAGVAIGLLTALVLTRFLRSLLFEISSADPATYAVVASLLLAVAALACWLPARRATRVDPMVALRCE
jgi:putative ABC transport system permease protein